MNISPDWQLIDGEQRNLAAAKTFAMPPREAREQVKVGDLVKIGVENLDGDPVLVGGERFWVEVTDIDEKEMRFLGEVRTHLKNVARHNLAYGDEVEFGPENILEVEHD